MPLRKRNASDRVLEKVKTHIMVSNIIWKLCHLWHNVEKYATAEKARWQYNTAHSKYVKLFAFAHQQWLHTHAPMVCLGVHYLSC